MITVVGTRLNGVAVDRYILVGDLRGLALLCLIMLAIYVVNIAATYVQNILMIDVAQRTSATLRSDLFRSILHLPQAYFDQHASGDLMSRLTNDVDNVNSTLSQSVTQLFSGIISIGGMLLAMLLLSPLLTLFAMIVVPMMMVVTRSIIKRSRRYFSALQRELGELNGYIEEMISGQKAVLLFQQEEAVAAEFDAMNSRLQTSYTLAQTFSAMGPFMSFINNITYVVVTLVGAMLILRGSLSVGVVFTFLLYMRNFSRPLNSLAALFNTIQSALAGAERVFEVIDEPPGKRRDRRFPSTGYPRRCRGGRCFLCLRAGTGAQKRQFRRQSWSDHRHRRPYRCRQDHDHQPAQPFLRSDWRHHHHRRSGYPPIHP